MEEGEHDSSGYGCCQDVFFWCRQIHPWVSTPYGLLIQDPGLVPFDGREARMMGSTPGWYGAHTDDQASRYLKPGLPESHHGSDVEFDLLKTCQN